MPLSFCLYPMWASDVLEPRYMPFMHCILVKISVAQDPTTCVYSWEYSDTAHIPQGIVELAIKGPFHPQLATTYSFNFVPTSSFIWNLRFSCVPFHTQYKYFKALPASQRMYGFWLLNFYCGSSRGEPTS